MSYCLIAFVIIAVFSNRASAALPRNELNTVTEIIGKNSVSAPQIMIITNCSGFQSWSKLQLLLRETGAQLTTLFQLIVVCVRIGFQD